MVRVRLLGSAAAALAAALIAAMPQTAAQAAVTYKNLYSFGANTAASGEFPTVGLTLGSNGDFYGVAQKGGVNYTGTVFQLVPSSGAVTTLYSFSAVSKGNTNTDGATPAGPLTIDGSGNLYGTTQSGGPSANGTIFKITSTGTFATLYNFPGVADGSGPTGRVILGSDGDLYGTTDLGGANGTGIVYQLNPSTGAFDVLHSFAALSASGTNSDGAQPTGLVVGTDGNLYGTTLVGGANNTGTIFTITTAGQFTSLYSFSVLSKTNGQSSNGDGEYPNGDLAFDTSGNLYGTAEKGGANNTGTVFEYSAGGQFTALYSFASTSNQENAGGAEPDSGLTIATDGNLYGATQYGGSNGKGVVYQITTAGVLTSLHVFNGDSGSGNSDGIYPLCTLTIGPDGNLYGTANEGGSDNDGVLFAINTGTALTAPPALTTTTSAPPTPTTEARFDFNKDGHADLVWYNTGTGGVSVWDMDDQSVLSYGATFTQLAPSSGWVPVATPDINADGYPDLLWWNKNTGELSFWTLQNTTVLHYYGDFATVADTDWKPVAAADVTGTTWELVFQNTATGAVSAWDMNGQTVTSYGPTLATLGANTPYQVVGAPDLDGDGKSDLLFWDSQTGGVSYWSCNLAASQVLSYHSDFTSLDDTSWHLVGSEDTNGDGHSDLLWWNAGTGEVSRWLLDGTTVTNYGGETADVPDTTWSPTAIR